MAMPMMDKPKRGLELMIAAGPGAGHGEPDGDENYITPPDGFEAPEGDGEHEALITYRMKDGKICPTKIDGMPIPGAESNAEEAEEDNSEGERQDDAMEPAPETEAQEPNPEDEYPEDGEEEDMPPRRRAPPKSMDAAISAMMGRR